MPPNADLPARRSALVAWALYDWANNGFATVILTFVFAAYFTRRVAPDEATGTAWWGNAIGAAGLAVALSGPVLGAIADRGGRRKPWIGAFTGLCVVATAALWWVRPGPESAPLALAGVATATLGAELGFLFYNAMLPALASPEQVGRWSGWGWGLGYAGGLVCLALALWVFVEGGSERFGLDAGTAEPVRATFLLAAAWYGIFALPLLVWTPEAGSVGRPPGRAVRAGLAQLRATFREARLYAGILRFLVARMLYADGLATVFAFGGVYAAGTFGMSEAEVLRFGIALNATAGLGAAGFGWVDDRIGPRRTLLLSLGGLLGSGVVVLSAPGEALFWAGGLALGVFVGPVQAASRSWLAHAAPPALRNQMFGLYAFSGKATAFLGPLLVGWVTWLSGSQRIGMGTVLVFFAAGLLLLGGVPDVRAAAPARDPERDA